MIWDHIGWCVRQDRPQIMPSRERLKPFLDYVLGQARRNGRTLDAKKLYCVYGLRKEREPRKPFYVGKGTNGRPMTHTEPKSLYDDSHKSNTILKIFAEEQALYVEIYYKNVSEATALALEMFLVSHFGRRDLRTGCLTNRTNGGDGQSGKVWTRESRNRRRVAAKSWWNVQENHRLAQLVHQMPEDVLRAKLAVWQPLFLLVQAHVRPRWSRVKCRCCGGEVDMKNAKLLSGVLPREHQHCADSTFNIRGGSGVYGKSGNKGFPQRRFPIPDTAFSFEFTSNGVRFIDSNGNELSRVQLPKDYLEARRLGERRLRA